MERKQIRISKLGYKNESSVAKDLPKINSPLAQGNFSIFKRNEKKSGTTKTKNSAKFKINQLKRVNLRTIESNSKESNSVNQVSSLVYSEDTISNNLTTIEITQVDSIKAIS